MKLLTALKDDTDSLFYGFKLLLNYWLKRRFHHEKPKLSLEFDENGIPRGISSDAIKLRRQMIYDFYEQWKSAHPEKSVYNKSLKANILIRQESVVEAAAHAAKHKNQRKLIRMILMSFKDPNLGTIKLTVGVRNRTLDKVQYGITALAENESIVPVNDKNKKKASHKK